MSEGGRPDGVPSPGRIQRRDAAHAAASAESPLRPRIAACAFGWVGAVIVRRMAPIQAAAPPKIMVRS
jgi:hypothetical protein